MPRNTAERLRSKIRQYAANPASLGNNVEAIAGEFGAFRLKVGEWRIVFRLDHDVMHVRVITSRGGAYRVRR